MTAALLCLAACALSLTHKPDFRQLVFQATADTRISEASALGHTVQMGPDDKFRIDGSCTASVSLVTAVYASRDVGYLLVVNRGGAGQTVRFARFIDLTSCREVWPPLQARIPIQVTGDAIQIEPNQWLRLFNDRPPLP